MPENKGYYSKFKVIDKRTGEEVKEDTFTVKLDSDPFARNALQGYIDAMREAGGYDTAVEGLTERLQQIPS